jgi:hypothetical protein
MNACENPTSSNADKIKGWWGVSGQFLKGSVDKCRSSDYPPGLTVISLKKIQNTAHPDDVTVISSSKDVIAHAPKPLNQIVQKNFIGFIYPFKYKSAPWSTFFLRVRTASAQFSTNALYLSTNDNKNSLVRD